MLLHDAIAVPLAILCDEGIAAAARSACSTSSAPSRGAEIPLAPSPAAPWGASESSSATAGSVTSSCRGSGNGDAGEYPAARLAKFFDSDVGSLLVGTVRSDTPTGNNPACGILSASAGADRPTIANSMAVSRAAVCADVSQAFKIEVAENPRGRSQARCRSYDPLARDQMAIAPRGVRARRSNSPCRGEMQGPAKQGVGP